MFERILIRPRPGGPPPTSPGARRPRRAAAAALTAGLLLAVTAPALPAQQPAFAATARPAGDSCAGTDPGAAPATTARDSAAYRWNPLKIGGGGFVTGLVVHPRTPGVVYGREDVGGLVRWEESTRSWTQLLRADRVPAPRAADYGVESVAVAAGNDRVVYAAVGDGGPEGRVLASRDRGEHWSDGGQRWLVEGNNAYRTGPERLAVDPADDRVVYFGTRTQGLYVSLDGARHWTQVAPGRVPAGDTANRVGVVSVLFDPASGRLHGRTRGVWATVAGAGVYHSTDAGRSWQQVFTDTARTPTDAKIADDGTLYVAYGPGGGAGTSIRRFTAAEPAGSDLTTPPQQGGSYFLGVDTANSARLLAADDAVRPGHLFRSLDGGRTWQVVEFTLDYPDAAWPKSTTEGGWLSTGTLVLDPTHPGRVWFPQGIGVWRGDDAFTGGAPLHWDFVSSGIEEMVTYDLIAPPGGAPISAVADRNGFRHTDPDGYPAAPILTDQFSAGTSLAYAGLRPGYVAAVSSDTRAQYAPLDAGWTSEPASGYSTDGGVTWTRFAGGKSDITRRYGGNIAVSADASSIVWMPTIPANHAADPANAGRTGDDVKSFNVPYVSRDNGQTWTAATGVDPGPGIHDMIWWGAKRALDADLAAPGTFYLYTTRGDGEFLRSTDGGATWARAAGTPPNSRGTDAHVFGQIHAVPGHAGHVWASTAQGGLWFTEDGGGSWSKAAAVQEARAFGFGKGVDGGYPTVFAHARIHDAWGVWRSTDRGATWTLVSRNPACYYTGVNVVTGDMNVPGRVYVGFTGNGFVYGDTGRRAR
ncbi:WD40/YVTN/BNR-like repeat-containing protein [Kitasatospora sp. NPDC057015]|uniref:WD40/YVTN/BNR-like repeat-containing protein n=1 Tax=Kitasatospora sp. NPDC057015 TaxID=3346001 RepID=UPI00363C14CA